MVGGQWCIDLRDYANAAILLRMALEAGAGDRIVQPRASDQWTFIDPARGMVEGDIGTVSAKALLNEWGPA
jgi:hypothetical protein